MKQVMVRYTVKPDRLEEHEALARAVYEELERTAPEGLRYATFKLDDGVSFLHLAVHERDDDALLEVDAFRAFREDLEDRVTDGPRRTDLEVIGSFMLTT